MFDSGANVAAIDCRIVAKSAYTGKYIRCRTFLDQVEIFLQCRLFIRTRYYTSLTNLCSIRKPMSELIVGQLKGIKKCTERFRHGIRKIDWIPTQPLQDVAGEITHILDSNTQVANMVMIRNAR